MSDEQNREAVLLGAKGVVLVAKGAVVSNRAITKMMDTYINGDAHKAGKQSLKDLNAKGAGIEKLEVSGAGLPGFGQIAKRYGINYSVLKDKTTNKTYFYFQSKNTQQVKDAFCAYTKKQYNRQQKPSILHRLEKARAKVSQHVPIIKPKSKEASL